MICPNCGTQNGDNSTFCTHCGAALTNNGGVYNQGAPANGSLSFAEGAHKVIALVGVDVLREPERFRAFMADECDRRTREYLVFQRNCVPALLKPYANAAANPSNAEELSRAAWMAEQYLGERQAEDVSTAHDIATALASAVASANGQQFNAQPLNRPQNNPQPIGNTGSSGTVLVGAAGAQSTPANSGANLGTGTSTLTTPSPYAAQPNPQNNKRNLAPLIAVVVVLVAILGGLLAFILLNPGASTSSSSAGSSSTSNSSAASGSGGTVVSFDGGSADSGSMESIEVGDDGSIVVPKCSYKRDGYEFVSWVDDKGNEYEPGDSLKASKSTTLTAKWTSAKADQDSSSSSGSSSSSNAGNSSSAPQKSDTQTTQKASPAASFPRLWSGTYIGTSSYVGGDHHISRAVAFNFTSVTDSGDLEGICYVGSDETGAGETYGTCYVAGNVDWSSGAISIYGTGWIDQGGLGDLREYGGTVNFSTQTMGGTAWDIGTGLYETPWDLHAVSEINIWQNGSLTTVR